MTVDFVYNVLDSITVMEIHTLRAPRGLEFCVKDLNQSVGKLIIIIIRTRYCYVFDSEGVLVVEGR